MWPAHLHLPSLARAAEYATAVGLPVAMLALLVAAATLLSGARTARLQQMHELFKEFLRLQFDFNAQAGVVDAAARHRLRANLGSFKMYSLEEMVLWLRRERAWGRYYFWSRFHRDHIASWTATVRWHLDECSHQDMIDMAQAWECYGPDFHADVRASRPWVELVARDEPAIARIEAAAGSRRRAGA